MEDLKAARARWLTDRPLYEEFVGHLQDVIKGELRKAGMRARVSGRPKEMDSLLKKFIRKPDKTYDTITDKAGVRVATLFFEEIEQVDNIIMATFDVVNRDDKMHSLGEDKVGYMGIHYDARLQPKEGVPAFAGLLAEIQLRTYCQDLWSEMAHELGYKADMPIPKAAARRLYCLSGLLEVADMEFSQVKEAYNALPDAAEYRVLATLEKYFLVYNPVDYDRKLSLETIRQLLPLYSADDKSRQLLIFEEFCSRNDAKLRLTFEERMQVSEHPLFLTQPEILLIFERLEADSFRLEDEWKKYFPIGDLMELADIWGTPLG